ncbi:MAG: hypothetical protein AAF567_18530 [Actinomycetota bacterium]
MATAIDLVCWDFGDTLVDERMMWRAPDGVPHWPEIYTRWFAEHEGWDDRWMLGEARLNDMVPWLAAETGMTRAQVSRHLRWTWTRGEWFASSRHWVDRLNSETQQAVVTVNPFEFSGVSAATGIDGLVDVIVTSADIGRIEKSAMAGEARSILGLSDDLATSLLIDNKQPNVDEFRAAGGHAIWFDTTDPDRLHEAMEPFFG